MTAPPPTDALLDLRSVWCHYGPDPVLQDLTLRVEHGDFTGIVGPSGSGKTTLLRALLGVVRPTHGSVERKPDLRLGYVPQVETVNWSFPVTVAEVVLMARCGGRVAPWPSKAEKREVRTVLDRLGIGDLGRRHIRELSGGQQQRVFIARALLGEPQLLLMDEPTSGVDVRTRHDVLHLLSDLNRDGLAIMVTTHDLNGIAAHLPHLICLNGVITGEGSPTEVLTADVLERTYGAPLEVLQHLGMPLVVDGFVHHDEAYRADRQRADRHDDETHRADGHRADDRHDDDRHDDEGRDDDRPDDGHGGHQVREGVR